MAKLGFLDSIEDGLLKGWALDEDNPWPAVVDIWIDGHLVANIPCSEFRPDLLEAHRGNGHHGFSYLLGLEYLQCPGQLVVRFSNSGPILHNGERALPDFTQRFLVDSALIASITGRGLWHIDQLELSESEVMIEGWCIPPRVASVPTAFSHNGQIFSDMERFPREDLAIKLEMQHDEIGMGFRARSPASATCLRHDFLYEHAYTRRPFDPNQSIHYICSDRPLPTPELRTRVHGSDDVTSFVKEGSTTYVQIERFLQEYFSRSIGDFTRILDWGCGSGRTLRYFSEDTLAKVTGIDVDPLAIEWSKQAFRQSEFWCVNIEPPTRLADDTFDFIYGISVLTHLSEKMHLPWLQELHRIAQPGAVLFLTVAGECKWWDRGFPSSSFKEWKIDRGGFFEGGRNRDIDLVEIGDNYRNVFISQEYVLSHWSRYFDIVDVIPMGISNRQDLVILQKRVRR